MIMFCQTKHFKIGFTFQTLYTWHFTALLLPKCLKAFVHLTYKMFPQPQQIQIQSTNSNEQKRSLPTLTGDLVVL